MPSNATHPNFECFPFSSKNIVFVTIVMFMFDSTRETNTQCNASVVPTKYNKTTHFIHIHPKTKQLNWNGRIHGIRVVWAPCNGSLQNRVHCLCVRNEMLTKETNVTKCIRLFIQFNSVPFDWLPGLTYQVLVQPKMMEMDI